MSTKRNNPRLFVPLSTQPYQWFKSGLKKWEIRRYGRQYTEKHVYVGKLVELRRGYSDEINAIWGVIERVEYATDIRSFFDKIPYKEAVPTASNIEEAISLVEAILQIETDRSTKVTGFKIKLSDFEH